MTILEELIKSLDHSELDEKVKIICDQIMKEEKSKIKNIIFQPKGPNIFLAIEFISSPGKVNFLCLERESKEKYIVSWWQKNKLVEKSAMKRYQVYPVIEYKVEKILKFYAETLKYLNGES
jgi:hypothetical protein